jgi:dTDP-4-amino-4,6-dideoxygalactose transaminase
MSTVAITKRNVPLLDLQAQHKTLRDEILTEVVRVIDSQKFIMGDDVKALEADIAAYCQTPYAIGCASGSDALFLALLAAGVGHGDHVLTTPYTFFATVGAICRTGATPVFADIEAATFNLDMSQVAAILESDKSIRAVIPVHLFGGCADMDTLLSLTAGRNIAVIEDAAQSIGSEYKGRCAGSIGDVGCFSFFPSKNLGCYGDGGVLTATDPGLATKLAALRVHGSRKKYYHEWIGVNSRLDALQAAVLRVKLRYLDNWTEARQRNAALYREILGSLSVPVTLPQTAEYQTRHIYNQFVICGPRRDELQKFLASRGIGTEVYYPLPMHLQECFAYLGGKRGDHPVSERMAAESLALPVYPELAPDQIEYVCRVIAEFYV